MSNSNRLGPSHTHTGRISILLSILSNGFMFVMAAVDIMTTMLSATSPANSRTETTLSPPLPKEKEKSIAQTYVDEILRCYDVLSKATCLGPSPIVNEAFTSLVSLSILILNESTTNEILNDPFVKHITPELRSLCSVGEGLLESFWAQRIAYPEARETPRLTDFPYYENYVDLTRLELGLIKAINPNPKKFAFLGCGPLPLTSFCIIDQLANAEVESLNVDSSLLAIVDATAISRRMGYLHEKVAFCCDIAGGTKHSISQADVVYLAALVGETGQEKREVLKNVVANMKSGAIIVIRTAWGLRKLLYPELRLPEDVAVPGLEILLVAHPYDTIVNSVILGRIR